MRINWRAIGSGLLGGILAAVVGGYSVTRLLDASASTYSTGDMVRAGLVALVGGIVGVILGWLVNGRRDSGTTGIAAIVTALATLATTGAWISEVAPTASIGELAVGAILLLGLSMIGFAAACGITAAMLLTVSRPDDPDGERR